MTTVDDRLAEIVAPLVSSVGLEIYDIELAGGILRLLVTGGDGVTVDQLGDLNRMVSVALDAADPIPGRYTLEVSSPGLERPLRTAEHFAGAVGEVVTVRTLPGGDGRRRVRGELASFDGAVLAIVDGDAGPDDPVEIAITDVDKARTVFEWGAADRPGRGDAGQKSKRTKKGPVR